MRTSSDSGRQPAIYCENIGKRYRIGQRPGYRMLRETVTRMALAPIRALARRGPKADNEERDLWALRDVSFQVERGEVLGIIGRNGSGKSTLLKILSRITKPTEGKAEIRGRIGCLLEVGAGFHPELTGRENIFLNGAILGMKRREIARKFDEIVEFAECGRLLDTPMKHYSSGMYVRLGFAVAAHLQTEILLVDEVLAVGDAVFQKKCLGRIGDVAGEGRTVLFVSHNMLAVDSMCTRAICLHQGKMVLEGKPASVTSRYLQKWLPAFKDVCYDDIETAPGNETVRLRRAQVRPLDETSPDQITVRTPFAAEFELWKLAAHSRLYFAAEVYNEHGISVFATADLEGDTSPAGLLRVSFKVPADLMNNGTYRISMGIYLNGVGGYQVAGWDDLLAFEVHDASSELRSHYHDQWPGAFRPHLEWKSELLEPLPASFAKAQGSS